MLFDFVLSFDMETLPLLDGLSLILFYQVSSPLSIVFRIDSKLDFIQMIQAKGPEWSEEFGKRIEFDVVFGCWCETVMLQNSVA